MADATKRLTREQIIESMRKACLTEPCFPVSQGQFGTCSICPNRKVKK